MATIRIKRGTGTPGFAALSVGEPAINTNLNTLFIKTASAGNSTDVKLIGAEIEAQNAANGFSAINWGSPSDSKLATQTAIETRFMPKAGGTFTGAVSFGQGSTAAGEIRLLEDEDAGSNYTAFRGSERSANITYVMPTTDPTSGQVLSASAPSTNVSTLSWVDAGAASTVTVTNDDTTTTLYPIFSTATSGSVSPKIDSDGMTYDAATDQLNGVNIKASNLLIVGDATDFDVQDVTANTILNGVFSTSTFNFIPINGDFTTYNFVVAPGDTLSPTINFGTGDLVSSTKTINIGTGGGSTTTTAINIGSTAGTSTTTVNNNLTVTGDVAVNGGDITTSSTGTVTVFNTNATTVNLGGAATTMAIGNTATAAQTVNMFTASTGASTYNFATGGTTTGLTKTINVGTSGSTGSTTTINIGTGSTGTAANVNLGSTGASGSTVTVNKDLVVTGNLTVNGTTVTVNSTTVTIDDPVFTLGGDTAPSSDDGKDRGIEFRWNNGFGANLGFMGWDRSATAFALWGAASESGGVYSTGQTAGRGKLHIGSELRLHTDANNDSYYHVLTGNSPSNAIHTITLPNFSGTLYISGGTDVAVADGGTGLSSYTTGQIVYASGTTTLAGLTASSTAGAVVASTGAGAAPEYKTISLTNGTVTSGSGTLTLAVQNAAADGSTKGLAAFNATSFSAASGVVDIATVDGGTYP